MDNILYQKDFRQLAMRDPNAAAKKLGAPVGANTTVSVKKNTASEIYFVIPDRAAIEEHMLDKVAGGSLYSTTKDPLLGVSDAVLRFLDKNYEMYASEIAICGVKDEGMMSKKEGMTHK